LATAPQVVDAFSPTWPFGPVGQAPVHAPRCHRVRASLEPRRRLPTFCNLGYDARAHPSELPDPRTRVAGTNRCRLRWPSMRFRAETSEPRPARGKSRAEALERRRGAFRERFRTCPPRGASGTLGRRCDCSRGWMSPRAFAPAKIRDRMAPRERRHRLMDRGAFCHSEILTRPSSIAARARRDRHPITPPPWRHCSGVRAPFGDRIATACL